MHYKALIVATVCDDVLRHRFNHLEDITGQNQAKSSVARGIRTRILDNYPALSEHIDEVLPKKEPISILKW